MISKQPLVTYQVNKIQDTRYKMILLSFHTSSPVFFFIFGDIEESSSRCFVVFSCVIMYTYT